MLTNSATSSPATALTWLAKPSSAWSGCTWLQIQLRVPGLVLGDQPGRRRHDDAAGQLGRRRRVGRRPRHGGGRGPASPFPLCSAPVPAGDPGGAERGELEEFAAIQRAGLRRIDQRRALIAAVRGKRLHGTSVPKAPPYPFHRPVRRARRHLLRFRGVSWARSLPGPLRRPLSRLVRATWDAPRNWGPSVPTTSGAAASARWAAVHA